MSIVYIRVGQPQGCFTMRHSCSTVPVFAADFLMFATRVEDVIDWLYILPCCSHYNNNNGYF